MKYIITGSLGHISLPVTKNLLNAGHEVTVVSHSEHKREQIESLGAEAAIGVLTDLDFLKATLKSADVAYLMIPSDFSLANYVSYQKTVAENYIEALKGSSVKHVVVLSSIGAHLRKGAGPIDGLGYLEELLATLSGVTSTFLRPSYFFYNLFTQIDLIKHAGIAGGNFGKPGETMILVHTDDIAEVATEKLLSLDFENLSVTYIASDERDFADIAATLGNAVGKADIPWVTFTDEQSFEGMTGAGLPEEFAHLYVAMGQAMRTGVAFEDYWKNRPALGKRKLEDFAVSFAGAYNA